MVHALGLAVPSSFEGRVAYEALEPAALAVRPLQLSADDTAAASTIDASLDAQAEAEIIERLQALGYVE